MKTVTEILGGSQILLDISYDIQEVFEDYLTDAHRLFLVMFRNIEDFFPNVEEQRAITGRKAYDMIPFIRAFLAKSVFKLTTNKDLILRLQSDSSLKRICGFTRIPSEATFSRRFDKLSRLHFMERTMNAMVKTYHKNRIGDTT